MNGVSYAIGYTTPNEEEYSQSPLGIGNPGRSRSHFHQSRLHHSSHLRSAIITGINLADAFPDFFDMCRLFVHSSAGGGTDSTSGSGYQAYCCAFILHSFSELPLSLPIEMRLSRLNIQQHCLSNSARILSSLTACTSASEQVGQIEMPYSKSM